MPKPPKGKRVKDEATGKVVSVRAKNANGDGSLYPRSSGGWEATWYDSTGKLRYARGRTRQQAIDRRAQRIEEDKAGRLGGFDRSRTTVAELAEWWLRDVAAGRVRPSSLGKYRDRVDRITAGIGAIPVAELRRETVTSWLAALDRGGPDVPALAGGTVRDILTVLRQILDQAVDLNLAAGNVAARAPAPKVERRPTRALTPEETRRLLAAARTDRLGAAVWMLFLNGWRVSEVLGLAWDDLDLDAGTVHVQRAAVYVDGQGTVLGPTKTAGARGVHPIAAPVVDVLRARRAAQASERLAAGPVWQTVHYQERPVSLVFTTLDGGLVNRQAVTKALTRCAATAGIDPAGLSTHTGRRTFITVNYVEGAHIDDISRAVGHSSPATTARYVRDYGSRPVTMVEAAARLFAP